MIRNSTGGFGCLAVIAVTIVGFAAAISARPGNDGCRGPHRGLARVIDGLDLDDATRTQVDAVLENARSEKEALRDDLHAARETLRELLAEAEPREAAVLAQADAIGVLESTRHRQRAETLLAVRQLIGAEAWAEFQASHAQRRGKGRPEDR